MTLLRIVAFIFLKSRIKQQFSREYHVVYNEKTNRPAKQVYSLSCDGSSKVRVLKTDNNCTNEI